MNRIISTGLTKTFQLKPGQTVTVDGITSNSIQVLAGLDLTIRQGVSAHSAGTVWISLITFTALYALLAVIWFYLLRRYVVAGPSEHDSEPAPPTPPGDDDVAPLSFAY